MIDPFSGPGTPLDVAGNRARAFLEWLKHQAEPGPWSQLLQAWPGGEDLAAHELRAVRVEVLRIRSFGTPRPRARRR